MGKLAINGGVPVREQMLQYGKQYIDDEDVAAVVQSVRSDFITQGPAIEKFEKAIADYVGAKYAIAFCNAWGLFRSGDRSWR
jgi:perosamine synthetase